jgi:hypothetical protein
MTIRAGDTSMAALQGESGFLGMVELRGLPARGRMAVGTLRTALAAMDVVRRMTGNALLRSALVAIAEVACDACDFLVPVAQGKRRLVVIEADARPGRAIVTIRAIASELALVRLLLAMTGVAIGRRFAETLALRMTTVARNGGVRTLQREIAVRVIELIATELDDVRVPSEMLGMTGVTLQ